MKVSRSSDPVSLPAYGWTTRPYQEDAWRAMTNPAKFKEICLAWHRRAGKDEIGMHAAAINAMRRVGNYWHMLPKGEQCRIAIWDAVNPHTGRKRWEDAFPLGIIKTINNQSMQIEFVTGSTWRLLGSDNFDNIVGAPPVGIFYSEAALANPSAFGFFRPILRENQGSAAYVSSVRGKNHFYEIFKSLEGRKDAYRSHLSARQSGVFSEEDLQAERRAYIALYGEAYGNALFEQEYLSSWDTAVVGAVWGSEISDLKKDGRACPCGHDKRYPVETSWDLGTRDLTVILFWQTVGSEIRLIDWYANNTLGLEHYAKVLRDKPYFYTAHAMPHDAAHMQLGTGEQLVQTARRFGLECSVVPRVSDKLENIIYGADTINSMICNVKENRVDSRDDCNYVLEALAQYSFKFDDEKKILSAQPKHDWTSHYADALSTYGHFIALSKRGKVMGRAPKQQQLQGDEAEAPESEDMWAELRARANSRSSHQISGLNI